MVPAAPKVQVLVLYSPMFLHCACIASLPVLMSKYSELSNPIYIYLYITVAHSAGATSVLAEAVEQHWLHGEHSNIQATKIRHWLTVR